MRLTSLHAKLTLVVTILIAGSVFATAWMMAAHINRRLRDSVLLQGMHIARSFADVINEKIAAEDLVALERLFNESLISHPLIAYVYLTQHGSIQACTFPEGAPVGIQNIDFSQYNNPNDYVRYETEGGRCYIHIALPILSDSTKLLHVGLNENSLVPTSDNAWLSAALTIVLVLILASYLAFIVTRKTTAPLRRLARKATEIDPENPKFDSPNSRIEELDALQSAFYRMIGHVKVTSRRLENRTAELKLAYRQLVNAFNIVRTVNNYATLREVCTHLIGQFNRIINCDRLAILATTPLPGQYLIVTNDRVDVVDGEECSLLWDYLADIDGFTSVRKDAVSFPNAAHCFQTTNRLGLFPIHFENQKLGALVAGCPKGCKCHVWQQEMVQLILHGCSGAVYRAINYAADLKSIQCQISDKFQFCGIVGKDRRMQTVFKLIDDIAPTDASVLIQGESGTGKELVARAIHERSLHKDHPFVVINCSAYPTSLLESELFGHEKGAFTGAIRQKIGRFEQADGGTVFLDEIGEIAPSAQINLLRVLQTQTFERIGGEKTLHVQVRVIAATNKDLLSEVKKGNFREDLYYRLNVIPICLPALKKRGNDIPLLARHFLSRFKQEQGKAVKDFSTETMRRLIEHAWPGNVRELENTVEHALVLTKGEYIEVAALPSNVGMRAFSNSTGTRTTVAENERKLFKETLEETGWNKKVAAQRLGVSRSTLYNKLKKYRLTSPTIH